MVDPGRLVDRRAEIERLERAWRAGGGLVLVYGRRRIGKTRLLLEWAQGRPHAYYQASLSGGGENVAGLAAAVEEGLGVRGASGLRDLRSLIAYTAAALRGRRAAVIVDEVTYWVGVDPSVASDLQWAADHVLEGSGLTLVLSGSLLGVVERGLAGGGAPLYGRARLRLRLGELEPWCVGEFAPRYQPVDLARLYSTLGGVPYYLRLVDDSRSVAWNLAELLGPGGLLEDEPLFIVRDEVRDPHPYLALLSELARLGAARLGKAASRAGIPSSHASAYAARLALLGLLERVPLIGGGRARLYRVADKPLRSSLLARGLPPASPERAAEVVERLSAIGWEELAERHSTSVLAAQLGLTPSLAGKALRRGEELDWVVLDREREEALVVEAKWSDLDRASLERLARRVEARARRVLPEPYSSYRLTVAVYARSAPAEPPGGALAVRAEDLPWGRC